MGGGPGTPEQGIGTQPSVGPGGGGGSEPRLAPARPASAGLTRGPDCPRVPTGAQTKARGVAEGGRQLSRAGLLGATGTASPRSPLRATLWGSRRGKQVLGASLSGVAPVRNPLPATGLRMVPSSRRFYLEEMTRGNRVALNIRTVTPAVSTQACLWRGNEGPLLAGKRAERLPGGRSL